MKKHTNRTCKKCGKENCIKIVKGFCAKCYGTDRRHTLYHTDIEYRERMKERSRKIHKKLRENPVFRKKRNEEQNEYRKAHPELRYLSQAKSALRRLSEADIKLAVKQVMKERKSNDM